MIKSFNSHTLEVLKGVVLSFTVKIAGAAFVLLFSVLLARKFGAANTGDYFLVISIFTFIVILGSWGVDRSLLKNIAAFNSKVDLNKIEKGVWTGLSILFIFGMISSIILYVLAPILAEFLFHDKLLEEHLKTITFAVIPFIMIRSISEIMKALKKVLYAQLYLSIFIPMFLSIALLFFDINSENIKFMIEIYVFSLNMIMFIALLHMYVLVKPSMDFFDKELKSLLLVSATPLFLITLSNNVQNFGGTYLLGILSTSEEIGIYNIAFRISFILSFILIAINSIVAPKFADLYEKKDIINLKLTLKFSVILGFILGMPLYTIMMMFPQEILALFGSEFIVGKSLLYIMATTQMVVLLSGPIGFFLIMTGEEKTMRNIILIGVCLFILVGIILIPNFGGLGAAIALSSSLIFTSISSILYTYKKILLIS